MKRTDTGESHDAGAGKARPSVDRRRGQRRQLRRRSDDLKVSSQEARILEVLRGAGSGETQSGITDAQSAVAAWLAGDKEECAMLCAADYDGKRITLYDGQMVAQVALELWINSPSEDGTPRMSADNATAFLRFLASEDS